VSELYLEVPIFVNEITHCAKGAVMLMSKVFTTIDFRVVTNIF